MQATSCGPRSVVLSIDEKTVRSEGECRMVSAVNVQALGDEVMATPYPGGRGLPLFLTPASDRLRNSAEEVNLWLEAHADEFDRVLAEAGAIVLRGFPIHSTDDFQTIAKHLPPLEMGYAGGNAPREAVKGNVMESTRADPSVLLYLHQEMAYNPQYPTKIAFLCNIAAEAGGETIVADVREIERRLPPELVAGVKDRGLRYIRNFRAPGRSTGNTDIDTFHNTWSGAFKTEDKAEVAAICDARGVQYGWQDDGSLTLISDLPGYRTHPVTGETVWFNQMHTMALKPPVITVQLDRQMEQFYAGSDMTRPFNVQYGDGGHIDINHLKAVYDLFDEFTVGFPWQNGDVMFVDNLHTAHGRNPFTGPRDVQVQVFA